MLDFYSVLFAFHMQSLSHSGVVLFNKPPGVVTSLRTASSGASDLHLKPLQDLIQLPSLPKSMTVFCSRVLQVALVVLYLLHFAGRAAGAIPRAAARGAGAAACGAAGCQQRGAAAPHGRQRAGRVSNER